MPKHSNLGLTATCVALVLPGSPALAIDQALIDAAKAEGKVVWYTSLVVNQVVQPIVEGFEAEYGIEVEFANAPWEETAFRIINEGQAGAVNGDVFDALPAYAAVNAAGLVAPYQPEAAADYDTTFKSPDGMWTAHIIQPTSPAVNTDQVDPADYPTSYEDLLDPRWKGKMAWTTSPSAGGPPGFIGTVLTAMGEEDGMAYLRKLAEQDIANIPSNQRVVLDRAVSGENPMVLSIYNYHVPISQAKGAPVEWIKIEPMPAHVGLVALLKDSPHPNAGKLLIEYILSEAGEQVQADAGYIPANPNVEASAPGMIPGKDYQINLVTPEVFEANIGHWIEVYEELFQ